jgi:hypothetical protein
MSNHLQPSFKFIGDHKNTFRVCGIPACYDAASLQIALASALGYNVIDVRVYSLASDIGFESQTRIATVSFTTLPTVLNLQSQRIVVEIPERPDSTAWKAIYIDSHFLGFTPLSPVENDQLHAIDCIAIHGWGGHAFGSFRDPSSCFMWIRDLLGEKVSAFRLWIYGYDSNLQSTTSYGDLYEYAATFRSLLKTLRLRAEGLDVTSPLVFIAHSLGGLLLKEAIINMHKGDESERMLLAVTYAVLFFGVPSQGMNTLALAAMVDKKPQRYTLELLDENVGQTLRERQHMDFCEAFNFRDSRFVRFYELVASPTVRLDPGTGNWLRSGETALLVSPSSAKQGRPWDINEHDVVSINLDHKDLVKFSHNDRVEFPKVEAILSDIARTAISVIQRRLEKSRLEGAGKL